MVHTGGEALKRYGSDVMVDAIKACGFQYVSLNPGSSYRGLHDSLVNYGDNEPEVFVTDVEQLAAHLMRRAVSKVDVPVALMQKRHKVEVVRDLKGRGMFHLRDAVDMVATALGVTRFTIYNYLNEIADEDDTGEEPGLSETYLKPHALIASTITSLP